MINQGFFSLLKTSSSWDCPTSGSLFSVTSATLTSIQTYGYASNSVDQGAGGGSMDSYTIGGFTINGCYSFPGEGGDRIRVILDSLASDLVDSMVISVPSRECNLSPIELGFIFDKLYFDFSPSNGVLTGSFTIYIDLVSI